MIVRTSVPDRWGNCNAFGIHMREIEKDEYKSEIEGGRLYDFATSAVSSLPDINTSHLAMIS
jgi:hypothetical protein